jgi:hypothetical protein
MSRSPQIELTGYLSEDRACTHQWRTVAALFRPWRRYGSGGCSLTPLHSMGSLMSSWPPSWRSFLHGEVVMSLYGESGCPIVGLCSLLLGSWNPRRLGVLRGCSCCSTCEGTPKCLYHPCILSGNLRLTFVVA